MPHQLPLDGAGLRGNVFKSAIAMLDAEQTKPADLTYTLELDDIWPELLIGHSPFQ